jgi:hypothetical protein
MQLLLGENNNSDHPAGTGRVASASNYNFPCGQKEKTTHKPVTWQNIRAPACMPIPGLDA